MLVCKGCGEQGTEEHFEVWEEGIVNLSCPKCGKEDLDNMATERVDPLAGWYKGTAIIQKPSEEKNETNNS